MQLQTAFPWSSWLDSEYAEQYVFFWACPEEKPRSTPLEVIRCGIVGNAILPTANVATSFHHILSLLYISIIHLNRIEYCNSISDVFILFRLFNIISIYIFHLKYYLELMLSRKLSADYSTYATLHKSLLRYINMSIFLNKYSNSRRFNRTIPIK